MPYCANKVVKEKEEEKEEKEKNTTTLAIYLGTLLATMDDYLRSEILLYNKLLKVDL